MSDIINIAVWGTGVQGSFLKAAFDIIQPEGIQLVCMASDIASQDKYKDGLPVKNYSELVEMYRSGQVHAVVLAVNHQFLFKESMKLATGGIYDIYYLPHYEYERNIDDFSFDMLQRIDLNLPRLDYIEYHIADHCNLNCRGCMHLSNISKPHYADIGIFMADLKRLRELFWGIDRIRLMGGEPLLNAKLGDFVRTARNVFPDTDLHIVSNGLLLNYDNNELLRTMHECNCTLDISLYPPVLKVQDRIRSLCGLFGVRCIFTERINVFRTMFDPTGGKDPAESHAACDMKGCTFLRNGSISNCILPYLLPEYSKLMNEDLGIPDNDIIDLYDPNIDGVKILERLKKPIKSCRFCDPGHARPFKWEIAGSEKAQPSDWMAEKEISL